MARTVGFQRSNQKRKEREGLFHADHAEVICIGANWLHERPKELLSEEFGPIYEASAALVPPKHWAWYILTSDRESCGTVPRCICMTDNEVQILLYQSKKPLSTSNFPKA